MTCQGTLIAAPSRAARTDDRVPGAGNYPTGVNGAAWQKLEGTRRWA